MVAAELSHVGERREILGTREGFPVEPTLGESLTGRIGIPRAIKRGVGDAGRQLGRKQKGSWCCFLPQFLSTSHPSSLYWSHGLRQHLARKCWHYWPKNCWKQAKVKGPLSRSHVPCHWEETQQSSQRQTPATTHTGETLKIHCQHATRPPQKQ